MSSISGWRSEYGSLYKKLGKSSGNLKTLLLFLERFNLPLPKTVLSVGSGKGAVELELCKKTESRFGLIEPDGTLNQQFEQDLHSAALPETRIIEYQKCRFEKSQASSQYELVYGLHSFYYIPLNQQTLQLLDSYLAENGHVLIILTTEEDLTSQFIKRFRPTEKLIRANDIENWLKKENRDYQSLDLDIEFDWQDFWRGEKISLERYDWISYYYRNREWRDDPVQLESVTQFFRDQFSMKNGYRYRGFIFKRQ